MKKHPETWQTRAREFGEKGAGRVGVIVGGLNRWETLSGERENLGQGPASAYEPIIFIK